MLKMDTRRRLIGMFVRTLLGAKFATLALIAAASAQMPPQITPFVNPEPATSAFGPDPTMLITTTFRTRIEGPADPREVPSATAQNSARRTLYTMAANECLVLTEFWQAECRLNSFSVYVAVAGFAEANAEAPQLPSMFGKAVYELKLKSAKQ
jgi:hypothetical protein